MHYLWKHEPKKLSFQSQWQTGYSPRPPTLWCCSIFSLKPVLLRSTESITEMCCWCSNCCQWSAALQHAFFQQDSAPTTHCTHDTTV